MGVLPRNGFQCGTKIFKIPPFHTPNDNDNAMNIWFGNTTPPDLPPAALTIGNFDGVHNGHRHILQTLHQEARARNLAAVAIVFEPQPNEFFAAQQQRQQPYRLSPLRDKLRLLEQSGCLDGVWVLRFNPQFAALSAEAFIRTMLVEQLNTRYLLIGDDFRFGKGRQGDFAMLAAQSEFVTERTPSILIDGERASSTAVRQALNEGRLAQAAHILGHDYSLGGKVKHGAKLGRTIGCPTANVHLPPHRYALQGVFVVNVHSRFGTHRGVANLGTNPTVCDTPTPKLEVHLFDFDGNLYGERVQVSFVHKLRDEIKFADFDAMKEQIWADMAAARNW